MECQSVELVASALLSRNRLSLHEDAVNYRLRSLFSCARLVRTRFRVRHHKMPLSDGEAFHMGTDLTFRKGRVTFQVSGIVLARANFGEDVSVGSIGHAESCFEGRFVRSQEGVRGQLLRHRGRQCGLAIGAQGFDLVGAV